MGCVGLVGAVYAASRVTSGPHSSLERGWSSLKLPKGFRPKAESGGGGSGETRREREGQVPGASDDRGGRDGRGRRVVVVVVEQRGQARGSEEERAADDDGRGEFLRPVRRRRGLAIKYLNFIR